MVRAARTARIKLQSVLTSGNTAVNKRMSTANPAALDAVDRKPATGVGAPSYTSGAQKWNGKSETLKANPASTRKVTPTATRLKLLKYLLMSYRFVLPVKP